MWTNLDDDCLAYRVFILVKFDYSFLVDVGVKQGCARLMTRVAADSNYSRPAR